MADVKRGGEAKGVWREASPAADPAVVTPRFDELEEATARPVVPLGESGNARKNSAATAGTGTAGGFSLRSGTRHLVLAWAVFATVAAGTFAIYRNAHTDEPQVAPQPATESTAVVSTPTPRPPARREASAVAPARPAKMTEARAASPSWDVAGWSEVEQVKRDAADEEELGERERKEEKRRRKEEKRRLEEYEEDAERALKEFRKQAARQRERQKDEGSKARLVGVITGQD
jgi:hypothetical protein